MLGHVMWGSGSPLICGVVVAVLGCTGCEVEDWDRSNAFPCETNAHCAPGYKCKAGACWDAEQPVCGDGAIEGGEKCDDQDANDGDGCTASCEVEPGWTCTATAPSKCSPVTCGTAPPVEKSAGVVIEGGLGGESQPTYGATAIYSCAGGYSKAGADPKCLDDGTWGKPPACEPNACPQSPVAPAYGSYPETGCAGTRSGGTCELSCEPGYSKSGDAGCRLGVWSTPACEPNACPLPPESPRHGTYDYDACGNTQSGGVCELHCAIGFDKSADASCLLGEWSEPTCSPVDCGDPAAVEDAFAPVIDGGAGGAGTTTYGATATYSCRSGFRKRGSDATCSAVGGWSPAPKCEAFCEPGQTCPDIPGCAGNPCFAGVTCVDVEGAAAGYACGACPEGYWGDGITCGDIDECADDDANTCHTGFTQVCENSAGSYACSPAYREVETVVGQNPSRWSFFGGAVSTDGNYALVGATGEGDGGAAYVFRVHAQEGTWELVKELEILDPDSSVLFGTSVSISGDLAIVGDQWNKNDAGHRLGAAYVFYKDEGGTDNWGQIDKLTASNGEASDRFGWSVSVDAGVIVVGASDAGGDDEGAAYVYEYNPRTSGFDELVTLVPNDPAAYAGFGFSVDISGDYAVVGAWEQQKQSPNTGAAYVFHRNQLNQWDQVDKLAPTDLADGDWFAQSVSIDGDVLVVGTSKHDRRMGAAYIFYREEGGGTAWGLKRKLQSDDASGGYYGGTVSLSGDLILVSAYTTRGAVAGSGAAYVYRRHLGGADNWGQFAKIYSSDSASSDYFGYKAVSLSGNTCLIGAYGADYERFENAGKAYFFELE